MLTTALPLLRLRGKTLLPILQGGMGVGVSAHRLAGAVAVENAVGTVASGELRHHHADLMERTRGADKAALDQANLEALDREVRGALALAEGRGLVAVNVMKAVAEHASLVRQACASGAQAIVMGAGLPLDLPELTSDFPGVALIPILSDLRGISLVLKRWMRKGRLPDGIVIEHPRFAGGHLGAPQAEEFSDPRFDFTAVVGGALALFKELGIESERIALIPAGGVNSPEKVRGILDLGANAVQLGTPFAVTTECDAHPQFKAVLAEAKPSDIVTFLSSAGLPARAVLTPWLKRYLEREAELRERASALKAKCATALECLQHCGLKDGISRMGQFCLDLQLAAALKGDVQRGLFFRGAESLPFGSEIRPVRELIAHLLGSPEWVPA